MLGGTFFAPLYFLASLLPPILIVGGVVLLIRRGHGKRDLPPLKFPKVFSYGVAAIILGFNLFAFRTRIGIGYGFFITSTLFSLLLISKRLRHNRLAQTLTLVGSLAGLMLGWHANGFVQGVNLAIAAVVLVSLILLHAAPKIIWEGLALARLKWQYFVNLIYNLLRLLRLSVTEGEERFNIVALIKTAAIAFVVIAIFAGLLGTADPIFREIIDKFLHQGIPRIFYSILIAVGLTWVFSVQLEKPVASKRAKLSWLSFQDLFVSVAAVVAIFMIFLFVQAKYLFLGNSARDLVEFGLTYSQYVRKGFAELLVVAVLGGGLAYVTYLKQLVLDKSSQVTKLKAVNAVLILQLGLVLVSALKRDLLYVDIYGLTRTRIVGGVFLLWLAGLLGLILALVLVKKMREKHAFVALGSLSLAVVLLLNFFNIDAYIAQAQPPANRMRDYFYINNLSEDAIDGWAQSIPYAANLYNSLYQNSSLTAKEKEELADVKLAMVSLKIKRDALIKKYGETEGRESKWTAFNLSEYRAYQRMQENPELFETQLNCLVEEIPVYQKHFQVDLYDEESSRLYEYDYPFVGMQIQREYYPINFEAAARAGLPSEVVPPLVTVEPFGPNGRIPPKPSEVVAPAYNKIPTRMPRACSMN